MGIFSPSNIFLIMALMVFMLGVTTFVIGVLILAAYTANKDIKNLATQTTRLAQKGIAEDLSGLVGNAARLMEAMNQLIRTSAGIGVFLTILGILLMAFASFLTFKLFTS